MPLQSTAKKKNQGVTANAATSSGNSAKTNTGAKITVKQGAAAGVQTGSTTKTSPVLNIIRPAATPVTYAMQNARQQAIVRGMVQQHPEILENAYNNVVNAYSTAFNLMTNPDATQQHRTIAGNALDRLGESLKTLGGIQQAFQMYRKDNEVSQVMQTASEAYSQMRKDFEDRYGQYMQTPEQNTDGGERGFGAWARRAGEAAAKSTASGYLGAAATAGADLQRRVDWEGRETADRQWASDQYNNLLQERDQYLRDSETYGLPVDEAVLADYNERLARLDPSNITAQGMKGSAEAALQRTRDNVDRLSDESAAAQQAAKDIANRNGILSRQVGSGRVASWLGLDQMTIGDVLTDASVAGAEMMGDVAVGALTGGGSMAPMVVRTFGAGASEAARNGATVNEQIFQGVKQAAIEWVTEKLFAGNPLYDQGGGWITDAVYNGLYKQFGAETMDRIFSTAASRIAKIPLGMMSEGVEEVLSDLLNPAVNALANVMDGGERDTALASRGDIVKDFIVGAAMGGFGNVTEAASGAVQNAAATMQAGRTIRRSGAQEALQDVAGYVGQDVDLGRGRTIDLGRAFNKVQEAYTSQAVENRLAELGAETSPALTEAVKRMAEEKALSRAQQEAYFGSFAEARQAMEEYRSAMSGDVNADNFWAYDSLIRAEDIGTDETGEDTRGQERTEEDTSGQEDRTAETAEQERDDAEPVQTEETERAEQPAEAAEAVQPVTDGTADNAPEIRPADAVRAEVAALAQAENIETAFGQKFFELSERQKASSDPAEREALADTLRNMQDIADVVNQQPAEQRAPVLKSFIENIYGGMNNGAEGNRVSDAEGRRSDGARAGVEAGAVRSVGYGDNGPAPQNRGSDRGAFAVEVSGSPAELNIPGGTETGRNGVIAESSWTDNMKTAAEQLRSMGYGVRYVTGTMEVRDAAGKIRRVAGIISGNQVWAQADGAMYTGEQNALHEFLHARVADNKAVLEELKERFVQDHSAEELREIAARYAQIYDFAYTESFLQEHGVEDIDGLTEDELDELTDLYLEEYFADAAGGINRVRMGSRGAGRDTGAVWDVLQQREGMGYGAGGMPGSRYSFARENDSAVTDQAEAMERDGADRDSIWHDLGIIRDASGIWVTELDDSKMQVFPRGDALLADDPQYQHYMDLAREGNFWAPDYAALNEKYGNREGGKKTLEQFVRHDALFERYPQLRNTEFIFRELPAGEHGYYASGMNAIVLDESLRREINAGQLSSTAIHEIQHAMQELDGRAGGSSMEYWRRQGLSEEEARENYRNTAGELEANEAARRAGMSAEERRAETPDLGWDRAVFAEDAGTSLSAEEIAEIETAVDDIIANKGRLPDKYNQRRISKVPANVADMVSRASGGRINISEKYIALSGSDTYHEYKRHAGTNNEADETGRGQIAFTKSEFKDAISCIFDPDMVETIYSDKNNPTQRQIFAYAKKTGKGEYLVVEAVGGNENGNIVPVEILHIRPEKWNRWIGNGKTIGEMIFENDPVRRNALDVDENKKNRVTAARSHSDELTATSPHSPRSNNSISDSAENSNTEISGLRSRFPDLTEADRQATAQAEREARYSVAEEDTDADADAQKAEEYFGRTFKINEAGYILRNGHMLDMSGKNNGAPGGYRTVDHRDISDALGDDYGGDSYSGAMVRFMQDGNIRLSPESAGINLSVMPNRAQFDTLERFISRFDGEVILDIDDKRGNTVVSVEYPERTRPSRVMNDIRRYFEEGIEPVAPMPRYSAAEDAGEIGEAEYDERQAARLQANVEALAPTELRRALSEDRAELQTMERLAKQNGLTPEARSRMPELRQRVNAEQSRVREIDQKAREERAAAKERQAKRQTPRRAREDFIRDVMDHFSVREGRAANSDILGDFFDRAMEHGVTDGDFTELFRKMIEAGTVHVEAESSARAIRGDLSHTRIFVPEDVRGDFGDNYELLRREAFANGIILTSDPRDNQIDVLNMELAESYPGTFRADELDRGMMLQNIVDAAGQGKAENISFMEMLQRKEDTEGWSVDDQLDNEMEWLRKSAEKHLYAAGIEVETRTRSALQLAKERAERREVVQRQAEQKALREQQHKTMNALRWIKKNDFKLPDELKQKVGSEYHTNFDAVLSDIDLIAISAANEMRWSGKHQATWRDLAEMYQWAQENDPNFLPSEELKKIWQRVNLAKIGEMDATQLETLYRAAVALRTEYYNRNNVINDELHRTFSEVYRDSSDEILASDGKGRLAPWETKGKTWVGKRANDIAKILRDMRSPVMQLERIGGMLPDGQWMSMAKQLQAGERAKKGYAVRAHAMLEEFTESHQDWIRRADGQGKDAIWYEIEVPELLELHMGDKPIFGNTVKVYMTPMQKVHLYLESKNYQNLQHMTGGRTFVNKELYEQGKNQEALAQGTTVRLAPETVKRMVSDLTEEEQELANLLERYYNGMAKEEINRVSNPLYGYDKAMTDGYAPIFTDANYNKSTAGIFDVTAEGVGHMKSRQQVGKNPSYNLSAIDAFEKHIDQTSRFVGLAIPVRNMENLLNWNGDGATMKKTLSQMWGAEGVKYIEDLLTELQSPTIKERSAIQTFGDEMVSNYITAVFGANPGIVFKQAASYPAAAAVLGFENIPSVRQLANVDEDLIGKYTPELAYRKMGMSAPEIAEMKKNPSWMDRNKVLRFAIRGGAITWMDQLTVKNLWPWAENYVRKNFPDLEVGDPSTVEAGVSPFYRKVAEVFNEAVNTTQPMYDTMNRADIMKHDNLLTRTFTMFKTVPLQEFNILAKYIGEAKHGDKAARRSVSRAVASVLVSTLSLEAVEALNALVKNGLKRYRDDDDELTAESFAKTFGLNIAKDLAGIMIGGSEIFEAITNHFGMGGYSSDFAIIGAEQINEMKDTISSAATLLEKTIGGAFDVAQNGGSVGDYLKRNRGDLLGGIHDLAVAFGKYAEGLPIENIEKYFGGVLARVWPEARAVIGGAFDTTTKKDLSYIPDKELPGRLGDLLSIRGIETDDGTSAELARLYLSGYKDAVPADTPTKIGERELSAYEMQAYDNAYSETIGKSLDALIESSAYIDADDESRAEMLQSMYTYANETAKLEVDPDYEIPSANAWVNKAMQAEESGVDAVTYIQARVAMKEADAANDANGKIKQVEAETALRGMDLTDEQRAVLWQLTDTGWKAENNPFAGGPSKMEDTGEYAAAGSTSGTTSATPAAAPAAAQEAAPDPTDRTYLRSLYADLEPPEGMDKVTQTQKYRAIVDAFDSVNDQIAALETEMSDTEILKIQVGYSRGVTPEMYVASKEAMYAQDDAGDNDNQTSQMEAKYALDSMDLSDSQRAVLWQLANKIWKPYSNPYDTDIGAAVYDEMHGAPLQNPLPAEEPQETPAPAQPEPYAGLNFQLPTADLPRYN